MFASGSLGTGGESVSLSWQPGPEALTLECMVLSVHPLFRTRQRELKTSS